MSEKQPDIEGLRTSMVGGISAVEDRLSQPVNESRVTAWARRVAHDLGPRRGGFQGREEEAFIETEVKRPPFVDVFVQTLEAQRDAFQKVEAGIAAADKLLAVDPGVARDAMKGKGRVDAAGVLQRRLAFRDSGITRESLDESISSGLVARANLDEAQEKGRLVSDRAVRTYETWETNESETTRAEMVLARGLRDRLGTLTADTSPAEKTDALRDLNPTAAMVLEGQEYSLRLLRLLGHQAEGVVTADGQSVTEQLEQHLEGELQQLLGVEVELTDEAELITSERIKQEVDRALAESQIDPGYADGEHRARLLKELGVTETGEGDTEREYAISERSLVRCRILAQDAAEAGRRAFDSNLAETDRDPDYAYATWHTAHEMTQAEAMLQVVDAQIIDIGTDVFARQQRDIANEIKNLERAQKFDKFISDNTETAVRRVRNAAATIIRGVRSFTRKVGEKVSNLTKLDDRRAKMEERSDQLEELKKLVKE